MFASSRFARHLILLTLVFGLAACGGGSGSSDQPMTFTVHGKVSNGPLEGSTVQVFGLNGGSVLRSATTDADGRYAAEVSSAGPYRLRTTGGTIDGVGYTGVLEASCATGSDCNVTPYTTVLLRLVDEHGFNAGDAASHLAAISELDLDPFVAGGPTEAFDLDAARQAISRGDGLSTWVASVLAWATGETAETPPGISKAGPAPDPIPDPIPDPDPEAYMVNATAGTGGDISPASQPVAHGATTTFTVSPDVGYSIDTVVGCGGSLEGNTYTTGAITEACTVNASLSALQYTVSATAGSGGDITPSSQTVSHGGTTSFTVNPDTGYTINSVTGCEGSLDGETYTTGPVTMNCFVAAQFRSATPFSVRTLDNLPGAFGDFGDNQSAHITSNGLVYLVRQSPDLEQDPENVFQSAHYGQIFFTEKDGEDGWTRAMLPQISRPAAIKPWGVVLLRKSLGANMIYAYQHQQVCNAPLGAAQFHCVPKADVITWADANNLPQPNSYVEPDFNANPPFSYDSNFDLSRTESGLGLRGLADGSIERTTDYGLSWSPSREYQGLVLGDRREWIRSLFFSPAEPDVIFASGAEGVLKSADAGLEWEVVLSEGPKGFMAADVTGKHLVVYSADRSRGGSFYSLDGGGTWSYSEDIPGYRVSASPTEPGVFVLVGQHTSHILTFHQ